MKKTANSILFSFFIIFLIFAVVYADVGGWFGFADVSFAIVLFLYVLYVYIQNTKSSTTFAFSLFFLVWMGLSYAPTGAGIVTERIGEWFYIFFLLACVQSVIDSRGVKKLHHENKKL
jgi:hypothetical protein